MTINNYKNLRDRLSIDNQYQSINCHRSSISSIGVALLQYKRDVECDSYKTDDPEALLLIIFSGGAIPGGSLLCLTLIADSATTVGKICA